MIVAFTRRRELLSQLGTIGLRVVGPGRCRDTNTVREFLHKNFVPFTWFDSETAAGRRLFETLGLAAKDTVIECASGRNPRESHVAGAGTRGRNLEALPVAGSRFRNCRGGPAGIAAAVYAASEGLSTLMFDQTWTGRASRRFVAD